MNKPRYYDWKCAICGKPAGDHTFQERMNCFNSGKGKQIDAELENELEAIQEPTQLSR